MSSSNDFCTTPGCITAASEILQNLHPQYSNIDPCQDFDQYVCGGAGNRFLANQDPSVLGSVQSVSQAVVEDVLKYPGKEAPEDTVIVEMLRNNYDSCMNETAITAAGDAGIPDMVSRVADLFPLDPQDYKSNTTISEEDYDDMAEAIAYLTTVGVPVFGTFWSFQDMENPEVTVPWFATVNTYASDIPLPSTSKAFAAFEGTKETIAAALQPFLPDSVPNGTIGDLAQGVYDLHLGFADVEALVSQDPADLDETVLASWETSTVQEVAKEAPAIVVDRVIEKLADSDYTPDRILLSYKSVYKTMSELVSRTPKATLQAFMFYRLIENYAPYAMIDPTEERATTCWNYLDASLPWIASKVFINEMYKPSTRDAVQSLTEDVHAAWIRRAESSTWLSDDAKKLIKEKVSDTVLNIGYPEEVPDTLNSTSLENYYSGVNITSSWFSNAVSIRQWASQKSSSSFGKPVNRREWLNMGVHSYTANARAFREENMIMIPAGMSQFPMFRSDFPETVKYGRLGYIIAHEITHHFDNLGSLISADRTPDDLWWGEDTRKEFEERTKCMVEQYDNLPLKLNNGSIVRNETDGEPLMVLGRNTLPENIADQGGLSAAFEAFRWSKEEYGEKDGEGKLLPGLQNFSDEQLFFIAAGQSWCDNYSEEILKLSRELDAHAPGSTRIKGMVANTRGFKEAFQCKEREPECEIW